MTVRLVLELTYDEDDRWIVQDELTDCWGVGETAFEALHDWVDSAEDCLGRSIEEEDRLGLGLERQLTEIRRFFWEAYDGRPDE